MSKNRIELTLDEKYRLTDYIQYVHFDYTSLSNEIGYLLLNRNYIYSSEEIEELCKAYISDKGKKSKILKNILDFINDIDLDKLFLYISKNNKYKKEFKNENHI